MYENFAIILLQDNYTYIDDNIIIPLAIKYALTSEFEVKVFDDASDFIQSINDYTLPNTHGLINIFNTECNSGLQKLIVELDLANILKIANRVDNIKARKLIPWLGIGKDSLQTYMT